MSVIMAVPKSPQDIVNWNPSKTYGGTYDDTKRVKVKYGVGNGEVYTEGGGVKFAGGGDGSSKARVVISQKERARLEEEARKAAEEKARQEAERKAQEEANRKIQEEKLRQEAERLKEEKKAEEELEKIQRTIQDINQNKAPTIKETIDYKTKEPRKITEYRDTGRKVRVVESSSGIKFVEYGTSKGGGGMGAVRGAFVSQPKPTPEPTQEPTALKSDLNIAGIKEPSREGQIYDSRSGMFLKSPYGLGAGGTAIMTLPTPRERELINRDINEKVNVFFGGEDYKEKRKSSKINQWFDEFSGRGKGDTTSFLTPSGIKKKFDVAAEGFLKAGEFIGKDIEKGYSRMNVTTSDSFLFKKSPIKKSTAKEIISTALMFGFFEPAMSTGTAQVQESQYVYDTKSKKFVKRSDLKKYLESPEKTGKVYKYDLTYTEKANRLNELLGKATTSKQKTEIMKLAQETYGKEFVRDFTAQEMGYSSIKPTTQKDIFSGTSGAEMKGISLVETTVSRNFNPDAVGVTNWITAEPKTDSKSKQNQVSLLKMSQDSKSKQDTLTKQVQITKQDSKQDSMLKSLLVSVSATKTKQVQKNKQIQDQIFKRGQPQRPQRPTYPRPPILPTTSSLPKRLLKRMETEGFEVFGRRFGKDISLGVFKSKAKADQRLDRFLRGTLGRSGFLKKGKKKVRSNLMGGMYRPSKADPFKVVQKRKYSLGTRSEVGEIQMFKKRKGSKKKKSNWFS